MSRHSHQVLSDSTDRDTAHRHFPLQASLARQMRIAQVSALAFKGGVMRQSCEVYRGYAIEVRVAANHALSFSGIQRRFTVSWSIYPSDDLPATVESFPERHDFISHDGAFDYGEKRARAFIDCKLACEPD
jgi:hypothetical protein